MQFEGMLNGLIVKPSLAQLLDVENKYQHLLKAAKYTVSSCEWTCYIVVKATFLELLIFIQHDFVCMSTMVGLQTWQNRQQGSRFSMLAYCICLWAQAFVILFGLHVADHVQFYCNVFQIFTISLTVSKCARWWLQIGYLLRFLKVWGIGGAWPNKFGNSIAIQLSTSMMLVRCYMFYHEVTQCWWCSSVLHDIQMCF